VITSDLAKYSMARISRGLSATAELLVIRQLSGDQSERVSMNSQIL